MMDLDKWIELVKDCKYLPENELRKLCDYVVDILIEENNVIHVSSPVTVCICMKIYVYMYKNICVYVYICMCMCMCVYVYMCMCICVCVYVYVIM